MESLTDVKQCNNTPAEQHREKKAVHQNLCRVQNIRRLPKADTGSHDKDQPNEPSVAQRSRHFDERTTLGEIQSQESEEDDHAVQRHEGVFPRKRQEVGDQRECRRPHEQYSVNSAADRFTEQCEEPKGQAAANNHQACLGHQDTAGNGNRAHMDGNSDQRENSLLRRYGYASEHSNENCAVSLKPAQANGTKGDGYLRGSCQTHAHSPLAAECCRSPSYIPGSDAPGIAEGVDCFNCKTSPVVTACSTRKVASVTSISSSNEMGDGLPSRTASIVN